MRTTRLIFGSSERYLLEPPDCRRRLCRTSCIFEHEGQWLFGYYSNFPWGVRYHLPDLLVQSYQGLESYHKQLLLKEVREVDEWLSIEQWGIGWKVRQPSKNQIGRACNYGGRWIGTLEEGSFDIPLSGPWACGGPNRFKAGAFLIVDFERPRRLLAALDLPEPFAYMLDRLPELGDTPPSDQPPSPPDFSPGPPVPLQPGSSGAKAVEDEDAEQLPALVFPSRRRRAPLFERRIAASKSI